MFAITSKILNSLCTGLLLVIKHGATIPIWQSTILFAFISLQDIIMQDHKTTKYFYTIRICLPSSNVLYCHYVHGKRGPLGHEQKHRMYRQFCERSSKSKFLMNRSPSPKGCSSNTGRKSKCRNKIGALCSFYNTSWHFFPTQDYWSSK